MTLIVTGIAVWVALWMSGQLGRSKEKVRTGKINANGAENAAPAKKRTQAAFSRLWDRKKNVSLGDKRLTDPEKGTDAGHTA
jgi:hypothetical protein